MKLLVGVTAGVAAKLLPKFDTMILDRGHEVRYIFTDKSKYFVHPNKVGKGGAWSYTDESEWAEGSYQALVKLYKDRGEGEPPIPHIDLAMWADAFAIVPLTANTLAKMANGICDNLLTSTVRAWPLHKTMVIAPAMNTQMWDNPFTEEHLWKVHDVYAPRVIAPVVKRLACGTEGMGALADLGDILQAIETTFIIQNK